MPELEWLVVRSRAGDLDAFGRLVRRFQDMAQGYAYSVLGDFHEAEDVVQESFIDVYFKLGGLREPEAFPGWLRRIVFKHCDRLMRRKRVAVVPLSQASEVPEPCSIRSELQEEVLRAVRDLPERQREATTLFYIGGYSQKEIAEFLEVPVTRIRKRLHDSRKRLRERMVKMVAENLKDFALPEDFGRRLLVFPFPAHEPQVVIRNLPGKSLSVQCKDAQDYFVPLEEGGRCDWTFYNGRSRRLVGVHESHVLGRVQWKRAHVYRVWARYTDLREGGGTEWREHYYHVEEDRWRWVHLSRREEEGVRMSEHNARDESFFEGIPMELSVGTKWAGFGGGEAVGVSRVSIGERDWTCLKLRGGGQRFKNPDGAPAVYSEWYVAESGRTVFFRRYNGRGFREPSAPTSFESLEGSLEAEYEGLAFRHAYDCISDIALSGFGTGT